MKRTLISLALLCASSVAMSAQEKNCLITYPAPEGVEMKSDFKVEARIPSGEWQDIPTYMVKVDEVRDTKHCVEKASLGYFDFEGRAEIRVTSLQGPITNVRIRPLSYGIVPKTEDQSIVFTLDCPRNLSIEVNGDIFHNLHLFANPIDVHNPIDGDKIRSIKQLEKYRRDVVYFGPGVHTIPGDTLKVRSGETVYIAGGAVVFGTVAAIDVENVNIYGRGRVHPSGRGAGVVMVITMLSALRDVVLSFDSIVEKSGIDDAVFSAVLKIIGIGYLTEYSSSVATDAGCESIAQKLQFGGKIVIFLMSISIVKSLVDVVSTLVSAI